MSSSLGDMPRGEGPPAVGGRRPRADARRNRARVLQAAHATFAERGLAALVEDIARRAGVGVGTLYRHFPTREALIAAVMADRLEGLGAEARAALEEPDPWRAVERVVWRMAAVSAEDRAFTQALHAHPEIVAAIDGPMRAFVDLLSRLVERAHDAGVLRRDIAADDLPSLVSGIAGATGAADWPGGVAPWERYVRVLLDGLSRA